MTTEPAPWNGEPEHPERSGPHWVETREGMLRAALWVVSPFAQRAARSGRWVLSADRMEDPDHAAAHWRYHGPCLFPAEVAARVEAGRREGIEAAARWHETQRNGLQMAVIAERNPHHAEAIAAGATQHERYAAEIRALPEARDGEV
jgi:hypothetical protein